MKKKRSILMLAALITSAILVACGSSKGEAMAAKAVDNGYYADEAAAGAYDGMAMEEAVEYEDAGSYDTTRSSGASQQEQVSTGRKLITTVNVSAETEDLDGLVANIEGKSEALGGYVESSSVYSDMGYGSSSDRTKRASMTVRIPSERLKEFLSLLEGSSNITDRSRNVEDVTLTYVDTQAHKEALKAEYESLLKLMENATSVEDIMAVEARITDVRYELESIESRLRTYDNQIEYSTVYINLSEVSAFTPQATATVGERMLSGLSESLESVAEGAVELAVFLVAHIPQIIILGIIIVIITFIIKVNIRRSKKRAAKKAQKAQQAMPQPQAMCIQEPQRPLNAPQPRPFNGPNAAAAQNAAGDAAINSDNAAHNTDSTPQIQESNNNE